jgi:hypothetical protein
MRKWKKNYYVGFLDLNTNCHLCGKTLSNTLVIVKSLKTKLYSQIGPIHASCYVSVQSILEPKDKNVKEFKNKFKEELLLDCL